MARRERVEAFPDFERIHCAVSDRSAHLTKGILYSILLSYADNRFTLTYFPPAVKLRKPRAAVSKRLRYQSVDHVRRVAGHGGCSFLTSDPDIGCRGIRAAGGASMRRPQAR